jgi:hypothetical protein
MTQQMYVCRLPLCDFIQTSFAYPNESTPDTFIQDTLDTTPVLNATTWQRLLSALKPVEYADEEYAANTMNTTDSLILDKLDWSTIIANIGRAALLNHYPIQELNSVITRYVVENWDICSKIPLANINRAGDIKGILWCFTKVDSLGGTDFEVLFMEPAIPITTTGQIRDFYKTHSVSSIQRGFKLESTHYWACKKYLDFEVEYNQCLYDSPPHGILSRLLTKWDLVKSIRAEPDITTKEEIYTAFYPNANKGKKTAASTTGFGDKKTWGYTKKIKKANANANANTSSTDIMLTDIPELDLS